MPEQPSDHRLKKTEPREVLREAAREFGLLLEPGRWLVPWAGYVLAVMVGRVLAGGSAVEIGDLFFGVPLAWLAGWLDARERESASIAVVVFIVLVGLAVGLFA